MYALEGGNGNLEIEEGIGLQKRLENNLKSLFEMCEILLIFILS